MNMLRHMNTPAGILEQFHVMQGKMCSFEPVADVSPMLEAFFERMLRTDLVLFFQLFETAPPGTELILLQFWKWLSCHGVGDWRRMKSIGTCYEHLSRLVKTMQLIREDGPFTQAMRFFVWGEQSAYTSVKLTVEYKPVKTWSASASVRVGSGDKATRLDNTHKGTHAKLYITECEIRDLKMPTFHYSVEWGKKILGVGNKATKMEAAEAAMALFYSALTAHKYALALEPKEGKEAEVYGNWMSEDEYNAARNTKAFQYAVAVLRSDERNDQVFVVGLQRFTKEKITTRIERIQRAGRPYMDSSSFSLDVTFEEGFTLSASLDWKVINLETHIEGEVYCKQCKQLYGGTSGCYMRMVETIGPLCGPCRDHLQDNDVPVETLTFV